MGIQRPEIDSCSHCADCRFLPGDFQRSFSDLSKRRRKKQEEREEKKKREVERKAALHRLSGAHRRGKSCPSRVTMPTLERPSRTCCGDSDGVTEPVISTSRCRDRSRRVLRLRGRDRAERR